MYLTLTEDELRRAAGEDPERAVELLGHHRASVESHSFRGVLWEAPEAMRRRLLERAAEWGRMLESEYGPEERAARRARAARFSKRTHGRRRGVIQ